MSGFMITTTLIPLSIANKILFAVLFLWNFVSFLQPKIFSKNYIISALAINSIFVYGYLMSFLNPCDRELAKQFVLTSLILFLIHFIINFGIDFNKACEECGQFMLFFTFLIVLSEKYPNVPFLSQVSSYINSMNQVAISERDFLVGNVVNTIAFSTVPFFYVPWCIVVFRIHEKWNLKDMVRIFLYSAAIILSGSRGVIIGSLLILAIHYIKSCSVNLRVLTIILAAAILIPSVYYLINYTFVFSQDEVSNKIKIGHLKGYINQLSWQNTIFGNGLGSYYYSFGKDDSVAHTELTPIDLARYLGIPLALAVFGFMLFPNTVANKYSSQGGIFRIAFFIYIIISMTNPVLNNSVGMLVVLWYWSNSYYNSATYRFR
jgi:hypothetical protein